MSFNDVAAVKALVGPGRRKSLWAEMDDGWTGSGIRKRLVAGSEGRRGTCVGRRPLYSGYILGKIPPNVGTPPPGRG